MSHYLGNACPVCAQFGETLKSLYGYGRKRAATPLCSSFLIKFVWHVGGLILIRNLRAYENDAFRTPVRVESESNLE